MTESQRNILRIIADHGPVSDWDIEHLAKAYRYNPTPSGVRTRRKELVDAGLVVVAGERQPTGRGNRTARTWQVAS